MVAGRFLGVLLQVMIEVRVQCALGQRLLQLIEQTILLKSVFGSCPLSSSSSSSALMPVPEPLMMLPGSYSLN